MLSKKALIVSDSQVVSWSSNHLLHNFKLLLELSVVLLASMEKPKLMQKKNLISKSFKSFNTLMSKLKCFTDTT